MYTQTYDRRHSQLACRGIGFLCRSKKHSLIVNEKQTGWTVVKNERFLEEVLGVTPGYRQFLRTPKRQRHWTLDIW